MKKKDKEAFLKSITGTKPIQKKDNVKKHNLNILENFKNHPHIFNVGHGGLPQTDPNMIDYVVNLVKDY